MATVLYDFGQDRLLCLACVGASPRLHEITAACAVPSDEVLSWHLDLVIWFTSPTPSVTPFPLDPADPPTICTASTNAENIIQAFPVWRFPLNCRDSHWWQPEGSYLLGAGGYHGVSLAAVHATNRSTCHGSIQFSE